MKNWTIKEAVEAINKNDAIAIKEISKHFPMFFLAIARNDLQALAAMMPEKFTVRRLQMADAAADEDHLRRQTVDRRRSRGCFRGRRRG